MSTRNRLTEKPNMRARYKTRVEVRQGALLLGSRVSRFGPSRARAAVTPALSQRQTMRGAALCRRMLLILLFLLACGFDTPRVFADTSDEVPGSSRTEDHVHVTARRAGDTLLITLRIDTGYHVNANPASDDYLIPTGVAFAGFVPERIIYPRAIPFKPAFADKTKAPSSSWQPSQRERSIERTTSALQ